MKPTDRVRVVGRGLLFTGQSGIVDQVLGNGLVGVKIDGMRSVEFFTAEQLRGVTAESAGGEAA